MAALSVLAVAPAAQAMDRLEIQVYEADMSSPGQFSLEAHTNYVLSGSRSPEYEGHTPPHHVGSLTLEPALGLTEWMELGAYLQLWHAPSDGFQYAGAKARLKLVLPTRLSAPFFFGMNMEVGRVPRRVEEEGWANEFRPILGYDDGWVLLDINPIFGYALSGPERFKPEIEPAFKGAINTQQGFSLGAEYYSGLGLVSEGLLPVSKQEHVLFGAFDLRPPKGESSSWELNAAVGRALTSATGSQWVVKAIFGRAF